MFSVNFIYYLIMNILIKAIIISTAIIVTLAQAYEDKRCRCVCPSFAEVLNSSLSADRKLFIADVPPNKCDCVGVILPRLGDEIKGREQLYCPRCECKYEIRNTTVIKVVVITVIWMTTLLMVYAVFLWCLERFMRRHRALKRNKDDSLEEALRLMQGYDDED